MEYLALLWEQVMLTAMWTIIYGKMFPASKLRQTTPKVIHIILISIIATICYEKTPAHIFHTANIAISVLLNRIFSKRHTSFTLIETLLSYIWIRTIWLIALNLGYPLYAILRQCGAVAEVEFICNSIIQGTLCFLAYKYIDPEKWEGISTKYSLLIISIASVLFTVSYALLSGLYSKERREFHLFVMLVIVMVAVILTTWVFNDYQHRKELEAKSKHIDDLVRGAHRYKEIIPAVSRELRKIAQEMGGEVSSELSIAIEEVDQLWNMTARQDREERKKAPNLNQTGLPLLDGQLEQEWREADAAGVSFECVVISPVGELAERVELFHLMQLVGDLFRNALRAIQRSGGENGRILLFLGKRREGYEIKMRDTGAPFPKEVLERLGERGLTTGGTGHGMADMLETLARYRASLEIQEEMETTAFTKTVSLLFDNEAMVRVNCPAQSIVYERHLPELTKI